jgi:putative SOS response-associated peptidase YedK
MCGRFALTVPLRAVTELFSATPAEDYRAAPMRYNICPTQDIDVVLCGEEGERLLDRMRWGFLPRWYKTPNDGPLLINARSETIHQKPAFKSSCVKRRCLIPASGFYEWKTEDGAKQPYYIHPANAKISAFAGVWRDWTGPDGMVLSTCAIVTCAASAALSGIHDRMPVTILPEDFGLWLGEEGKGAAVLMRSAPEDFYAFHRVSREINKARSDAPELQAPLE